MIRLSLLIFLFYASVFGSEVIAEPRESRASDVEPLLGAEFTTISPKLLAIEYYGDRDDRWLEVQRLLRSLDQVILQVCPECEIHAGTFPAQMDGESRELQNKSIIHLLPDLDIQVFSDDPAIETTLSRMPPSLWLQRESLLNALIFQAQSEVDLRPNPEFGGGHIHFDLETLFGDDPLLFRNFIVDFLNHSDVFEAFGAGETYSPTIRQSRASSQANQWVKLATPDMQKMLDEFIEAADLALDQLGETNPREAIYQVADALKTHVYSKTDGSFKFQALNVARVAYSPERRIKPAKPWEDRSVEVRVFRAQNSVREFLADAKIITGRVEHLKNEKTKIPLVKVDREYSRPDTAERLAEYVQSGGQRVSDVLHAIYQEDIRARLKCRAVLAL